MSKNNNSPNRQIIFDDTDIAIYHLIFLGNLIENTISSFTNIIGKIDDTDEKSLQDIPSLLNNESNQLKELKNRISPSKIHLFYSVIFIHKTKWPVRAEYILKDKKLFYKITAGTNVVMVPCGGINS